MFLLWILIIVLLIALEFISITIIPIWFAIGGLISLFLSLFINSFIIQFIIFLIFGFVLKAKYRDKVKDSWTNTIYMKTAKRVIGKNAVVVERIEKNNVGKIKVNGRILPATSKQALNIDAKVRIVDVSNDSLIVEKTTKKKKK
jgi:membrane protein implicated in regulation of membrane protease activity